MTETKSDDRSSNQADRLDSLFSALSSGNRRLLVRHLSERAPEAVPRDELATVLAARRHGAPRDDVTDDERRQATIALQHDHLPRLGSAGLVELDADGETVALADHPALRDAGIRAVVDGNTRAGPGAVDELLSTIADRRRRTVLDVLSHQYQPVQVETLARDVGARERDTTEEVPQEAVERVLVSLRHVHLPALAEADLIGYDDDAGTVAYEGHPDLRVPWMHSELGTDFRASLTDSPPETAVGSIEGRERIVSYGQSLCDAADEELFLMFTTTGLLEAGCFTRLRQAADRGVDVYLGTCDPTVREFVQQHAPEVTLWEPETNWLDLPVEEDNVGRLVFSDREAVMIGTLGEPDDDGVHSEQAIVGDGENNALVVMMRQLLQSRLARFDERDDELESDVLI